jgi:formylglycine-generating enzyme required for sulfatase activity
VNKLFSPTLAVALFGCLFAQDTRSDEAPPLAKAPFGAERAKALQQGWARYTGKERVRTNSIGMKLILLPPGEFTMGRTEEQFDELLKAVKADPKLRGNYMRMVTWSMLMMPAHRVRITRPFYMGATEVSVGQFRQFVEATGYKTEAERGLNHGVPYKGKRPMSTWRKPMAWRKPPFKQGDDEPVMHLCWNDCVAFCKWLSEKEGQEYRLPTEAEWEYACRAGTTTPWNFGNLANVGRKGREYAIWSDGGQKFDVPHAVGRRKPNAWGLYDMHGNMWEYVSDWWHRLYYKESPINDPRGPEVQSEKGDQRRIIRGGSFDWGRWGADSAYRMRITQRSNQHPHMSFRVAMTIKGAKGVPPAIDPDERRREKPRDPGADSDQVVTALKAAGKAEYPRELKIDLGGGVKMEFVLIPAGSFRMGSGKGPKDERPIHRVVVTRPFYLAKFELTQSQWEAVMGKDKRLAELAKGDNDMAGPDKAMNGLSWKQCRRFIDKLRAKVPGHAFALPTEAQWEHACRAGSSSEFYFGDDADRLGEYAWFEGNMIWPGKPGYRGRTFYHDVGRKKPNRWGLYDMHGGVWEWCADWYDADYYLRSPLLDPKGPESGRFRVLRGGSWFRYARYARSAYRRPFHPEGDSDGVTAWILDFGCRVAINLPATGGEE